jgi:hypothetical protein
MFKILLQNEKLNRSFKYIYAAKLYLYYSGASIDDEKAAADPVAV